MADRVAMARKSIAEIDERANTIRNDIKLMIDSDERMKRDESYRNKVINEKLREVQRLQEESQVHQRTILQFQQAPSPATTRVTRSRAAAVTSVATNIQQATRESLQASRAPTFQQGPSATKSISEEDQKRSTKALFDTRNWLINRESELCTKLESSFTISEFENSEYLLIQGLCNQTESLCANLTKDPNNPQAINQLRQIIQYVSKQHHT